MAVMDRLLFIGIGGTGAKVGAQLEDDLRHMLCGPSGDRLLENSAFSSLKPYQLPDFIRSIYIDLDGDVAGELTRGRFGANAQVIAQSRNVLQNLMPPPMSYPDVAACLRAGATRAVVDWLPPRLSEPRVSPLSAGAGQFPTVGRAAFYEMLRSKGAQSTLFEPFRKAIKDIDGADIQLRALGEGVGHPLRCNVYVAFSLAGGTGCGLFLDILHLIEECFAERTRLEPVVHPLVALPSSFDVEKGGGRTAQLNAATAVIDLARYIDGQNTGEKTQVVFPDGRAGTIRAATRGRALAPTAYLFSRPLTHSQDDHLRVMATFVGANVAPASDEQVQADLNHHQVGVNRSTERSVQAPQGIGHHPFTMACSGALSVPDVEVSMVLAETILESAVSTLRHRVGTEAQVIDNAALLDLIRVHSGLIRAIDREPPRDLGRLRSERGADNVRQALQRQRRRAKRNIEQYEERLREEMGEVAAFAWKKAIIAAVEQGADPYQIAQVIGMSGTSQDGPSLRKDLDEIDFDADTVEEEPPEVPPLRDRLGPARFLAGRFGLKPDHADVNDYVQRLNRWQRNRATQAWQQAWRERRGLATAAYQEMVDALGATIATLEQLTRHATFNADTTYSRLFERRQGVVNYVPQVGSAGRLSQFHDDALARVYKTRQLQPSGTSAVSLLHDLGSWRELGRAASTSRRANISQAIDGVMAALADHVGQILRTTDFHEEAMLPSLSEMLQWAADGGSPTPSDLPQRITEVLASVLASATDIRLSPKHIVVSYPTAGVRDSDSLESFLRRLLDQAATAGSATLTIQRSQGADLAVTAIRSEVPLLEVPEARRCIMAWDEELRNPAIDNRLWWRQRTGWETHSYLTSDQDHVHILFALLNGLWSGIVLPEAVAGNSMDLVIKAPNALDPRFQEMLSDVDIRLTLVRPVVRGMTPWSGLIPAFEHFVVTASDPEWETLRQWMTHIPAEVARADPESFAPPRAYREFADAVDKDLAILNEELASGSRHPTGVAANLRFARRLFTKAYAEALEREFGPGARYRNHNELRSYFTDDPARDNYSDFGDDR